MSYDGDGIANRLTCGRAGRRLVKVKVKRKGQHLGDHHTHIGWYANALIGYAQSTPSTVCLCALKAYLLAWTSGDGSKYSTAIRPSIEPDAQPAISTSPSFSRIAVSTSIEPLAPLSPAL